MVLAAAADGGYDAGSVGGRVSFVVFRRTTSPTTQRVDGDGVSIAAFTATKETPSCFVAGQRNRHYRSGDGVSFCCVPENNKSNNTEG
jgi:hypothetical protein